MTCRGGANPKCNEARALELAVIGAFFTQGSAASIAQALSTPRRRLHAGDVTRIWSRAKDNGELPRINRPAGGPRLRIVRGER